MDTTVLDLQFVVAGGPPITRSSLFKAVIVQLFCVSLHIFDFAEWLRLIVVVSPVLLFSTFVSLVLEASPNAAP